MQEANRPQAYKKRVKDAHLFQEEIEMLLGDYDGLGALAHTFWTEDDHFGAKRQDSVYARVDGEFCLLEGMFLFYLYQYAFVTAPLIFIARLMFTNSSIDY